MALSEYEERAWVEIVERKRRQVATSPRRLVPQAAREAGKKAAARVKKLPGAETVGALSSHAYRKAAEGMSKATSQISKATLSEQRLVEAYKRRGVKIDNLRDIRDLDLETVEQIARPKRMNIVYASVAFAEGAASGGVISGGEALATVGSVASAGASSAPGIGLIATTVAADAVFVMGAASRAVGHTALYYGYDPLDPAEELFILSIINLGSAVTSSGKVAAYQELSKLTQMLARRATWKQLNEHVLPRVAQQFAVCFGGRLTQRKLGQFVPIAGIAIGGALNYKLLSDVTDAAYWAYRERFLLEKQGSTGSSFVPEAPTAGGDGEDEASIDLLEILEQERTAVEKQTDEPPEPQAAS